MKHNTVKNLFIPNITYEYNLKVVERLADKNYQIKLIGTGKDPLYSPKKLDKLIQDHHPEIILLEDLNYNGINNLANKQKDLSWLCHKSLDKISYYERLFYLSLDRISFFPDSHIKRSRLFLNCFSHLYGLFIKNNINCIFFFGTPHGVWSIMICAVAEYLDIDLLYSEASGLTPMLTTIEDTIRINRDYSGIMGSISTHKSLISNNKAVRKIVQENIDANFFTRNTKKLNYHKVYLKKILGILFKYMFSKYNSPELFSNDREIKGYEYILPLIKYYYTTIKTTSFYTSNSKNVLPKNKALSFFLHQQPEASTMPLGNIFADQLLVFDIIKQSLGEDYSIIIKEHPYMFADAGQERHERSKSFYSYLLKDKRVCLADWSTDSLSIIKNSEFVLSICGTVGWQAMLLGKPCIIFGNAWFSQCKSCYTVDSISSLKVALDEIKNKTSNEVKNDLNIFLENYSDRLIQTVSSRQSFIEGSDLMNSYDQEFAINNLSEAIDIAFSEKLRFTC